jgi:hypothetical protein
MEAVRPSETSVNFYETTQRNIPEDSHLHTRRRENLNSHLISFHLRNLYNWNCIVKKPKTNQYDI